MDAEQHRDEILADAEQQRSNMLADAEQEGSDMLMDAELQCENMLAEAEQEGQQMLCAMNQECEALRIAAMDEVAKGKERVRVLNALIGRREARLQALNAQLTVSFDEPEFELHDLDKVVAFRRRDAARK